MREFLGEKCVEKRAVAVAEQAPYALTIGRRQPFPAEQRPPPRFVARAQGIGELARGRFEARRPDRILRQRRQHRSEEHTSELQSLLRISYAVFCLKKKNKNTPRTNIHDT